MTYLHVDVFFCLAWCPSCCFSIGKLLVNIVLSCGLPLLRSYEGAAGPVAERDGSDEAEAGLDPKQSIRAAIQLGRVSEMILMFVQ